MIRLSLFLSLLFTLDIAKLNACTCDGSPWFIEVSKKAKVIGLFKVLNHNSQLSMLVELIEIYKGVEARKVITVFGDNGNLCRPYVDQFRDSAYYVFALYSSNSNFINSFEKPTDYYISSCGQHWLGANYSKGTAEGRISKWKRKIKLEKLHKKINGG